MKQISVKTAIYDCIENILIREQKKYASLKEIYAEVANYLEVENNPLLQSQIRGRLQECCSQYSSFLGEDLFLTEKVRSGKWTIKNIPKKYIHCTHQHYLVSDDNWITSRQVDSINSEYVLEKNHDYIFKAKVMQLIGSKKTNIILAELNKIREMIENAPDDLVNEKDDTGYGLSFEVFSISVLYDLNYRECFNKYIVHNSDDGGIDSIYYGDKDEIYIYQIKIGNITDDAYTRMQENFNLCIRRSVPKNGKDLFQFINNHHDSMKGKKINFRSISDNSQKSTNIKPIEIYQKFFENKLLPPKNNNLTLTINKPTFTNFGNYQYNVSTDGNNNFNFYLEADLLIKYLIESLGIPYENYDYETVDISKYFSDNVRGVLSINKKMIDTIQNEPQNFVKYNNGINITGEVRDLGDQIEIKNPIINNGQQTITTLIRLNKNLNKINIPIKITDEKDLAIKGKISQYSNEQVKVKAIDMLSLNPYVRNIQTQLFEQQYQNENFFLKIYSSGKKSYYEIMEKLYDKYHIIELLDFIKLYFSITNKKDLGMWKNSPNFQIENTIINSQFDLELSFKVCKTITIYENYIMTMDNKKEKDDLKSADLAFKYLICKYNLNTEIALEIIHNINNKYFYQENEKSKLIDIYKSSSIIDRLEAEVEIYQQKEKTVKI